MSLDNIQLLRYHTVHSYVDLVQHFIESTVLQLTTGHWQYMQLIKVKVMVKVTLRLTVSQSVSMSWCQAQILDI
jgi:hypothetical protein